MEEKMKVINLLEDGKISPQEAIDLLNALNLPKDSCKSKERYTCRSSDFEDKLKDFGKNVELFTKDIGDRLNDTAKIVEPKIKNAAKAVLEKAAALIDEMSKSLQEQENEDNKEVLEDEPNEDSNENSDDDKPIPN